MLSAAVGYGGGGYKDTARYLFMRILAASVLFFATACLPAPCRADSRFTVERVLAPGGAEPQNSSFVPSLSADGKRLVFGTWATNFAPSSFTAAGNNLALLNRTTGSFKPLCSMTGTVGCDEAKISGDGQWVVFRSDLSGAGLEASDTKFHIFLRPVSGGRAILVDQAAGAPANGFSAHPAISYDGSVVAFLSTANDLVASDLGGFQDVFVYSRSTGVVERVSVSDGTNAEANSGSSDPALSGDGSVVAFCSTATNLVAGDMNATQDVFVRDRNSGKTELISVATSGEQANDSSETPSVSGDGRYVLFRSLATNLSASAGGVGAPGYHVFLRDRVNRTTRQVDVAFNGALPDAPVAGPTVMISGNGRFGVFPSQATNLVSGHSEGSSQAIGLFLTDLDTQLTKRVNLQANGAAATSNVLTIYGGEASVNWDGRIVAFAAWGGGFSAAEKPSRAYLYVATDPCPSEPQGKRLDLNHNGVFDCAEPGGRIDRFVPPAPTLTIKKRVMTVTMPTYSTAGLQYVVTLKKRTKAVSKAFSKNVVKFTNVPKGTWTVSYKLKLLKLFSKSSKAKSGIVR